MTPRIGIAALLTLIVFYLAIGASHAQFVSGGLFNNGQATTSPTPPPPSYAGPNDVPGVGSAVVWWSADSCISSAFTGTIVDLADTLTGTSDGTRLVCGAGGVVSAVVSSSACTWVAGGGACSPFLTTCGPGPTYTCSVIKLYDQSGASLCSGPCDVSDPLANAPALVGGVDGSTANCMLFTTANPSVLFGPALGTSISQPYTVIGVFERSAAFTTEGNIFDWHNLTLAFNSSANSIFADGGAGAAGAVTASDTHLHAVQFVMEDPSFGGTSNAQVDSTPTLGITTGPNGPNAGQLVALGGASNFLTGYVCEIGIWPIGFTTTPTTGEMALMNANMHTRNGF